jgi:Kef-type K+ transport system membrane component KefB
MMSISFIFLSPIFSMKGRLEKAIRWILAVPFVVNICAFVLYSISFGLNRDYRFEVVAITINWSVTVLVGILIGIFFRREIDNMGNVQNL